MLICEHCGATTEYLSTISERHYECDRPCYEYFEENRCPSCGTHDVMVEAKKCKICGEYFKKEDLMEGICPNCLDEEKTVKNVLGIGDMFKEKIEINGFAVQALGIDKINDILCKWCEENFVNRDGAVMKYCDEDELCFADYVSRIIEDSE